MGGTIRGVAKGIGAAAILAWILLSGGVVAAQSGDDTEAREQFMLGRAAFSAAEYEDALIHFQEAYRLSGRVALQYNIGVTASRLRRDDEALAAFEKYLAETEDPPREQEVKKRVAALQEAIEQRERAKQLELVLAMQQKTAEAEPSPAPREDRPGGRVPKSAIIGSSVLAGVGVAGVVAMGVGLSGRGQCVEQDVDGTCTAERTASPWVGVYGAVGIAALAGSATWLLVSRKRTKDRSTSWNLSPTGVTVSGTF